MKLLYFTNTAPEYRIPFFRELASSMNVYYCFTDMNLTNRIYKNDINFEKLIGLSWKVLPNSLYNSIKEIRNIFIKEKYDFVELPPIDTFYELVRGLAICFYGKKQRAKILYHWEKWDAPKDKQPIKRRIKNFLLREAARLVYKNADHFFAGGAKSEEYFCKCGCVQEKITILPDVSECPDCEYEDIKRVYNIPISKKIILYFGRIFDQKGLDVLINAFHLLPKPNDYHLLIVGEGEYKEKCVRLAKSLNLSEVTFVGYIHPDYRKNFFSQCDIFVLPGTFRDGRVDVWGLTLNEAIQFDKVVISTTAVGSAYDLIEHGINGFCVEPENPEEIVKSIMLVDNTLYQTTKQKDAELRKIYSYKNMAFVYRNTCLGLFEI